VTTAPPARMGRLGDRTTFLLVLVALPGGTE
jgi:hypothetical protein